MLPAGVEGEFVGVELVEAHQPVGLVEPVLAQQGRLGGREGGGGVGDGAEGGEVDPAEAVIAVEVGAEGEDVAVGALRRRR